MQVYSVNGTTFQVTSTQKNLIDQYLNQYDVSSTDADYIATKIDAAFAILRASGKTSFYNLSKSDKDKIVALASDVTANTSVHVAITKSDLIVYAPGTNDVFYKTPVKPNGNGEVRQTNAGLTVAACGLISMAGIAVVLKRAKNNA